MANQVAREVLQFLVAGEGWLVGGAADPEAKIDTLRDWDIFIPFHRWHHVAPIIAALKDRAKVSPNSFGGWKLEFTGQTFISIDVWPDSMENLVGRTHHFWQPHMKRRLTVEIK